MQQTTAPSVQAIFFDTGLTVNILQATANGFRSLFFDPVFPVLRQQSMVAGGSFYYRRRIERLFLKFQ